MSRTHKDRHRWKRKERNRTGKSDPAKIKLHRERFLERIEQRGLLESGYKPLAFRLRLEFHPADAETDVLFNEEVLEVLPFLVEAVDLCHYVISARNKEFDAGKEKEHLAKHVAKVKHINKPCHLEQLEEGFVVCKSAVECRYRKWQAEKGLPCCTK